MRMDYKTGPKLIEKMSFAVSKVKDSNYKIRKATHSYHEIIYLIEGRIKIINCGEETEFSSGDCFFIKSDSEHEYCSSSDSKILFFNIGYKGELPEKLCGKAFTLDTEAYENLIRLKEVSLPPMDDLKAELGACILTEFILRIAIQISSAESSRNTTTGIQKRYYSKVLNQAINIINKRYKEDLRIDQISSELCTSTSTLRTMFRNQAGSSFTHHLQSTRVEAAKELLYKGADNINSIARKVGYKSLPAFYKVFRRFTGITPVEFVKQWELKFKI
ncbi:MAG: AraC family transcriptional regulator [Planctomycetota bacterium]